MVVCFCVSCSVYSRGGVCVCMSVFIGCMFLCMPACVLAFVCMFVCVLHVCLHVEKCIMICLLYTCSCSWIKVDGDEYKLDTGVIIEVTDDMPTIGVIKKIF